MHVDARLQDSQAKHPQKWNSTCKNGIESDCYNRIFLITMKSESQPPITLQSVMMQPCFHINHRPCPPSHLPKRSERGRRLTAPRSSSIPINCNSPKSKCLDLKLREEEALADLRDYVMFRRIVDRLSHQDIQDFRLRRENDMCLAHVIGIRNGSEDQVHQNYYISDFATPTRPKLEDPGREDGIFELEL